MLLLKISIQIVLNCNTRKVQYLLVSNFLLAFMKFSFLEEKQNLGKNFAQFWDFPEVCNFIEIVLWHGCSPVNLLHIFRISFPMNTSEGLLLKTLSLRSFSNSAATFKNHFYYYNNAPFQFLPKKNLINIKKFQVSSTNVVA